MTVLAIHVKTSPPCSGVTDPLPVGAGAHLNFSVFLGIKSGCLGAAAVFVLYKKN